jgi:hypothetical protein
MSFNLIQGIHYSEHNLEGEFDNDYIIKAVRETYTKPGIGLTEYRPKSSHPHHTFYEDVNIPEDIYAQFALKTTELINEICDTDDFKVEDVWGHLVRPNEQTMVHSHRQVGGLVSGLAWVYYPHMEKDMGNLHFISDAGGNRVIMEVPVKPSHLYIFSREILHFTPINATKTDRVSISGNFNTNWAFLDNIKPDNNFFKYIGRNDKYDTIYD